MAGEEEESVSVSVSVLLDAEKEEEKLGVGQGAKKEKDSDEGLKPWEQHSAVISIPRYDYRAPSSILDRSHSGFLITCPIKREKSATKEAISIVREYVGSKWLEPCGTNTTKKRKLCSEEANGENIECAEKRGNDNNSDNPGKFLKEANLSSSGICDNVQSSHNLSLVKLTRSGLLLFTLPKHNSCQVVDVLSSILLALRSGNLKQPLWCHRIFPIQETCVLIEKDLRVAVLKLVREYLGNEQEKLERPIKFAVGYNRRGIEETEMKILKTTVEDSERLALLDRDKCFKVVAGAFKEVAKNSTVDLRSPEVAVLVELLPVSGLPQESLVVGVSVLPHELIATKPRLCVRPLVSDTKVMKKRG